MHCGVCTYLALCLLAMLCTPSIVVCTLAVSVSVLTSIIASLKLGIKIEYNTQDSKLMGQTLVVYYLVKISCRPGKAVNDLFNTL
jgi:hypothetical protein